jgi:hypothetical protein
LSSIATEARSISAYYILWISKQPASYPITSSGTLPTKRKIGSPIIFAREDRACKTFITYSNIAKESYEARFESGIRLRKRASRFRARTHRWPREQQKHEPSRTQES